ncbi:lipoxygenase 4, chloroplastic, partial [Tanacetum coccineum]
DHYIPSAETFTAPLLVRSKKAGSVGFNIETVEYKNISFLVWDVGAYNMVIHVLPDQTPAGNRNVFIRPLSAGQKIPYPRGVVLAPDALPSDTGGQPRLALRNLKSSHSESILDPELFESQDVRPQRRTHFRAILQACGTTGILSPLQLSSACHGLYKVTPKRVLTPPVGRPLANWTWQLALKRMSCSNDAGVSSAFTPLVDYCMEISAAAYKHWLYDLDGSQVGSSRPASKTGVKLLIEDYQYDYDGF